MRFVFDIVHPAHVHFFKHIIRTLESRGHQTRIVAREKDVTTELLDRLGFQYDSVGRSERKGLLRQASELALRDLALFRVAREFRPDVIATRSPAGAQVGRLLGIRSVFDTDDGRAVGIHYWSAAPFAHVITTPDAIQEDYGSKHVKYPGYKQSAYLHPNHFTPDPGVLSELGLKPDERFFIMRFVAMVASHDRGEVGISEEHKVKILNRLREHGRVFITAEGALPAGMGASKFPLPADRMHHALAYAALVVGDSATVSAESTALGTPSLLISSWAGRLDLLRDLERYGLNRSYEPERADEALAQLDRWLAEPNLRESLREHHRRWLSEKRDIAGWYSDFLEAGAPTPFAFKS